MTTGEKIKRLRKERNWTQDELGEKLGVKKAAINKYENGTVVNLKRETIYKLAKIFDIDPTWLLTEDDEWPPTPSIHALVNNSVRAGMVMEKRILEEELPKNDDVRLLLQEMNRMTPEQIEQVKGMFRVMFKMNGGKKEDDA